MTTRNTAAKEPTRERAALVRVATRSLRGVDGEIALDELAGLTRAAGAEVVLTVVQERATPDSTTFIGAGKAKMLATACDEADVQLVVVDNELSPAQTR